MHLLMKRFWSYILIAVLIQGITALCGSSVSNAAEPKEILLVFETKPNSPRYLGAGTDIDWEKPGLTLEMFRIMEEMIPVKFNYKRVPWKRGLYMVQTNQADGIFHASFKKKRMAVGVYPMIGDKPDESRAVLVQNYVFYKKMTSPVEWNGKTLLNLKTKVGVPTGYSVIDDLKKIDISVEEAKNHELNFIKLMGGRIDAVADLENMADLYLKRDPEWEKNIIKLSPPFKTKAYYLLLSHGFYSQNKELAEKIWDATAKINQSDRFKKLITVYSE